jgi:hypothetical protein
MKKLYFSCYILIPLLDINKLVKNIIIIIIRK